MIKEIEILVLGSGCTGLVAALQAHQTGKKVAILEKMDQIGGNSKRASSGMNATETVLQLKNNIIDTAQEFYDETFKAGGKMNDPALLQYFTTHTNSAVEWLKAFNVELGDLTTLGGMNKPRTHRPTDTSPIGAYLVNKLFDAVQKADIPVYLNSKAVKLTRLSDQRIAVEVENNGELSRIKCNSVILATGGFGASQSLIKKYAPQYADYKTTNQEGSTGDGLKLAHQFGAQLIQLNQVQIHPTVQQDNPHVYLIGETVRGEGAILVNTAGKRFINELDTRKKVSNAIITQETKHAYLILDQQVYRRVKALGFYESVGLVVKASSLDELAKAIHLPVADFKAEIETWNQAATNHYDQQFGRQTGMHPFNEGPFYAIHVAPAVHYTMGGIHIDTQTHVLDENGEIIPGLFAAGEVSGGLHGNNRVGGNSIAETIVFGRQAGISASQYLNETK